MALSPRNQLANRMNHLANLVEDEVAAKGGTVKYTTGILDDDGTFVSLDVKVTVTHGTKKKRKRTSDSSPAASDSSPTVSDSTPTVSDTESESHVVPLRAYES